MTTRTTAIEDRREAYREFFDFDWATAILRAVAGTKLQDTAIDLGRTWQAASQARSWPWVLTGMQDSGLRDRLEKLEPLSNRKIRIIRDRLVEKMVGKGETIRPMLKKKIQAALIDLDDEATEVMKRAKVETIADLDDTWSGLVKLESFHNMIWSSERSCYASLYFNYEWFLKECVRLFRDEQSYRMGQDFSAHFRGAFGQTLLNACWHDLPIQIARETRVALAHNGGKVTDKLAKLPHGHLVNDDEIQLAASATTALYHCLKDRVSKLVTAACPMPEFALPQTAAVAAES